ncbi:NAD-dependent epimerase/dehydratase family protein [Psychrobacter sp. ENNN9_III]|uniref:NAD-dependent epimerase/dehydratase family protein n=1 Tax=Psychrobacter sp. ENNN9_III TaxID=1254334 RepID=UPI000A9B6754|nr:NAD-dependent epimerase/dehydratase family protein [Psychrobacter sp. ENNN9_III]
MNNKILVAGGAGYIGSHTCIELHQVSYDITSHNSLSNTNIEAINYIRKTMSICHY